MQALPFFSKNRRSSTNKQSFVTMATSAIATEGATTIAVAVDSKVAKLREILATVDGGVDAFIIPSEDPHMVS